MANNTFLIDLSERFPHLDSSPIVESVIHCVARARRALDEAELREELVDRLPDYPHIQPQHWKRVQATLTPDGSASQRVDDGWHGLRLTSEDQLFVLQVNRDGVVFSRLGAYYIPLRLAALSDPPVEPARSRDATRACDTYNQSMRAQQLYRSVEAVNG